MKKASAREGNTGILTLRYEDGREELYVPDCDYSAARALLREFQQLKTVDGVRLQDSYTVHGINWFFAAVAGLYGRIFTTYVRYRTLAEAVLDGRLDITVDETTELGRLLALLASTAHRPNWKGRLLDVLAVVNNLLVARRSDARLLFFRFTPDDFRTQAAKQALDDLGAVYVEAFGVDKALLLDSLRRGGTRYFFGRSVAGNRFRTRVDLGHADRYKRALYLVAIETIERKLSAFIAEYHAHRRVLTRTRFQVLYGIDDTQVILPLVYACQDTGVLTIAHQHGAAYQPYHASYILENFEPHEVRWFDTLITWGTHWRDRIAKISHLIPADNVVVGSDIYGDPFGHDGATPAVSRQRRAVLLPYEFLTSTYHVGRYLTKLFDLGYEVWFKPRSDEDLGGQIAAYCLPAGYAERLKIVGELTPAFMERIDVIAGTMTTLLYQLLIFRKPVWLFDINGAIFLEDLVEMGYAHRVSYDDLDSLEDRHFQVPPHDVSHVISRNTLKDTLAKHVLGACVENGAARGRFAAARSATSPAAHV